MKTFFIISAFIAIVASFNVVSGQGDEPKKLNALMQKKLENAQKVLEGIALNDCEKIAKHAEELIIISKTAEWKVHLTPQYEMHSNEFRRTAQSIVQEAKAKNLDGATLAYLDLTMNCVKCHKYVREVRMTLNDRIPAELFTNVGKSNDR